jgi:hypothetical protein
MDLNPNPLPTELHYHLKCLIVKKKISFLNEQSKGIEHAEIKTDDFIYLIPQESTQTDLFFAAWLPDISKEVNEIGCRVGSPVYGLLRAYVRRANNIIQRPHIGIMSKGAEDDIIKYYNSKTGFLRKSVYIEVETLGEHEDSMLDQMKDFELPFQKKDYESKGKIINVQE